MHSCFEYYVLSIIRYGVIQHETLKNFSNLDAKYNYHTTMQLVKDNKSLHNILICRLQHVQSNYKNAL